MPETKIKKRCRQNALCNRNHEECDFCGRKVHGLQLINIHSENPFGLCMICRADPMGAYYEHCAPWMREETEGI